MHYYTEKDKIQLALEANDRRLLFELRDATKGALNRARAAMHRDFSQQVAQGNVSKLENDTEETRRYLLEAVFKELNNGYDIQSSLEA